MTEKQKVKIKLPLRRPPQAGGVAAANNWSPGSKPTGPAKPLPPKAPPAAQPLDDDGDGKIEMRRVDELHPHPLQKVHFKDQPDHQFNEFVEDIRNHGIREPLEILPDGTILSGHQRRRAAIRLNWTEVPVRVRHDLAEAGEAAIEMYFIASNYLRRQLTGLEEARLYKRVLELKEQSGQKVARGKLRDEFAARLGKSGRQLDRYVAALNFPRELQDAVDEKKLPMVQAERLMKRPREEYEPVLKMLREGLSIRKEVNRLLLHGDDRAPLTETKLARMWRVWLWTAEQLTTHQEAVGEIVKSHQQDRLLMAQELAGSFLASLEQDAGDASTGKDTVEEEDDESQNEDQSEMGEETESGNETV